MQPITPIIADKCFSVLVRTIKATDRSHLRWAFAYALTQVHVKEYRLDSNLGITGKFCIPEKGMPIVTCSEITPVREVMLIKANNAIREILEIKPAKKIRTVPITASNSVHVIVVKQNEYAGN